MRAAAWVCGVVLALAVAPLAFGHGTDPDAHGLGPWAGIGRAHAPVPAPGRELPRLRTARSRTFLRADGTHVVRLYQQSQFFRDGSSWKPIDNRLERRGGALTNAGNRFDLSIPRRLGDAPLRIANGGRSLSFRLLGAADVPAATAGADATFRDVMPGVTARWSAQNDSVKEQLVLRRRGVATVFRYDVAGSRGLRVKLRPDGGLDFVDAAGRSAFVVPAAFGYDAKGFEGPPGTVSLSAKPGGSGWIVEMRVARAWLQDRGTAFPVTVDPTIEVPSVAGDCKLDQELSSESFCSLGRLEVGWGNYGAFAHDHRSILKFDVDQALPPGATVTSAKLHAYLAFRETGTTNKSIRVHRVTTPWTDDASWLNSAAGVPWTTPGGDFSSTIEAQTSAGQPDTWYAWTITNLVSGWENGTIPNRGLLLKDNGNHTDGSMVFASSESDPWAWPYLEIAYTGGAPEGPALALTGGLRTPLSSDRQLHATATDNDGVARVAIWLDPDLDPTFGEAAIDKTVCSTTCTADYTLPDELTEGRHTMLVRTEDALGGVTRKRWDFTVAALGAADRSRLGLEQWFQYDTTDTGGDSNLYVNADTGNVVWHSVPIVDPGRGLSTVVNLTYNSLDHGGLLRNALGRTPVFAAGTGELTDDLLAPLSYSEAGSGFSIAVSGPTRINEPLHGVVAAATAPIDGMKIRMTDADGTEHAFTYAAGEWVSPPGLNMHLRRFDDGWAMTRPDGVTHFFDDLGFLTSTKDRNGNTLTYTYERINAFDGAACLASDVIGTLYPGAEPRLCIRRLVSVTDPGGRDLTIAYEEGGVLDPLVDDMLPDLPEDQFGLVGGHQRISKITDHAGREYTFDYDDNGYLVRFTEAANKPDARVTGFHYEAPTFGLNNIGDDRMLDEVQDIRDDDVHAQTHIYYDDRHALPAGVDRDERRPYQVTKRSGMWKQLFWDEDDVFEVRELLDNETDHTGSTFHEVDEDGRPVSVTDALGTVTKLAWSDDNKVTRLTRAFDTDDESVTDYTYDEANGTGVLESQTTYPRWPSTTDARTTDLQWAFGAGVHHTATEATGTFVADLVGFENPKPGTGWTFTLDPAHPERGNITKRTDAKGNFATTTYDDDTGVITHEEDEEGNPVDYSDFDPTGQPRTVVDERRSTWRYKYDAVGNVTTVIDPRAAETVTGEEGDPFTTTLSYDSFDRLTREHIPKRSQDDVFITRTREFDRNGNVVSSTDGRGEQTTIDYTAMDLPSVVTAPGSNGSEITRYAYDAGDRLIGTIAPKGDGLTTPDDVEETQGSECGSWDAPQRYAFLTRYCLDDVGRVQAAVRTSTRSDDQAALISSYGYDKRDNVIGVVDPKRNAGQSVAMAVFFGSYFPAHRFTYLYNKVDEREGSAEHAIETLPGTNVRVPPTVWQYVYDANGNQIEIQHPRGETIRTHITYDHRDQVVAVEDPLGHMTCLQRRKDERVVAQTTPRGTEDHHADCFDGTGYTHYTTRFKYDPAGDLEWRAFPYAPHQYNRDEADLAEWKVRYERNAVGDPTQITDARGHAFQNTFFDTGELRTTERPSWWDIQNGSVVERTGRSANAAKSDSAREHQSSLGQTDFGRVDPEPLPDLLPMAGHTELSYDGEMNLTGVTDAANDSRTLHYDPAGRVDVQTWPFKSGNSIQHEFTYDKDGNLASFTDGEDEQTTYDYDGYDRQIERTAPGANPTAVGATALPEITRFRYDENDNLRFVETPRGVESATADDYTFETTYDSLDRVASKTAPDGGTTSYDYDVASNVISVTRPRGQGESGEDLESFQTRMNYDDADRLIESRQQVMDGGELVELPTTFDYDADDNLTKTTAPGAKGGPDAAENHEVTSRVFDGRGLPWKTTVGSADASERTSIVEYDPDGNLRRIVKPRGVDQDTDEAKVDDTGTNKNGNLSKASENATVFRYDANDLVVAERMPWSGTSDPKYRRLFLRTDTDDNTVDELGRLLTIVSPHAIDNAAPEDDEDNDQVDDVAARTSYSYYANDWIRSSSDQKLVDPSSQAAVEHRLIFYDYDDRGLQKDWESKNFGEDSAGRHILREFWPNGQLKKRTAEKTAEGGDPSKRTYEYLYNRNESLVAMNDIRGQKDENATDPDDPGDRLTRITRDPVERQSAVNETWKAGKDTRFDYDVAGNVITRWTDGTIDGADFIGADHKKTTFVYDSLDRDVHMTVDPATGANRETTTNYWPSGNRESRVKPNGTTERWFFNSRGEITRHDRKKEGAALQNADITEYGYDPNGNRDEDERGTYEFNARDQLTKWTKGGKVTDYQLNGDGAITEKSVTATPGAAPTVTTFEYRGERLKWSLTAGQKIYYQYDDFGNVTRIFSKAATDPDPGDEDPGASTTCDEVPSGVQVDQTFYCYDEFERLRLTKAAGQNADRDVVQYDGLDRRDSRTRHKTSGPDKVSDYSYIGTSELLSRDEDDDGVKRFYDYDAEGDRIGQQVDKPSGSHYRAYVKDANGSVTALEDDNGDVAAGATYDYDPYGELENGGTLNDDAEDNPFRFEGFYYDSGVKTYDMLARPYRPDTGRFLTQDRFASADQDLLLQADPLTQNRYAFAGGNPVNNIEFDGHKRIDCMYCTATSSDPPKDKRDDERRHQQTMQQAQQNSESRPVPSGARTMSPDSQDRNYRGSTQRYVDEQQAAAVQRVAKSHCPTKLGTGGYYTVCNQADTSIGDILNVGENAPFVIGSIVSGINCGRKVFIDRDEGGKLATCAGMVPGEKYIGDAFKGAKALKGAVREGDEVAEGVSKASKFTDDIARACGLHSFGAQTLVTMADGSKKPISQIKVGDRVVATNPLSGTQSARRVTHVWVHQDRMIRLNVAGEMLVTTKDHPFWNATDHAWQRADEVDRGDVIGTVDGRTAKYRRFVGHFWREGAYNLTVQGVHTYHVGARGLLVHNSDPCGVPLVDESKFDYIFGRVTSSVHNMARSRQNLQQMTRLGIRDDTAGRALVREHLTEVGMDPTNISRKFTTEHGLFEVRDSLLAGPSGQFAHIQSTWQVLENGQRRLTTVIPIGG